MKITMVHGQNHKGSTYHIGKMLADKLGGEVTEFFLPKDFGHFCIGAEYNVEGDMPTIMAGLACLCWRSR